MGRAEEWGREGRSGELAPGEGNTLVRQIRFGDEEDARVWGGDQGGFKRYSRQKASADTSSRHVSVPCYGCVQCVSWQPSVLHGPPTCLLSRCCCLCMCLPLRQPSRVREVLQQAVTEAGEGGIER